MLNFTGSDWCGWCKLMDKEVFAKDEWKTFAAENVVLVTLDFPKDKSIVPEKYVARNKELQEAVRGARLPDLRHPRQRRQDEARPTRCRQGQDARLLHRGVQGSDPHEPGEHRGLRQGQPGQGRGLQEGHPGGARTPNRPSRTGSPPNRSATRRTTRSSPPSRKRSRRPGTRSRSSEGVRRPRQAGPRQADPGASVEIVRGYRLHENDSPSPSSWPP